MLLIRSITFFIVFIIVTILWSLALVTIGTLLPYHNRCKIANSWGRTNILMLRLLCGLNYKLYGIENLLSSNCIVMSKHQSTWETISFRGIFPPTQSWILKKELLAIPLFGWALKLCDSIAIDRKSGRKAIKYIVDKGIKALEQGRWIIIFPEGTRVAPGERRKYGIGGAILAEKSGYPVVPIAHNAGNYWRRRELKKYPGTISVIIGEPIISKGKKASVILKEVEQWIEEKMEEL